MFRPKDRVRVRETVDVLAGRIGVVKEVYPSGGVTVQIEPEGKRNGAKLLFAPNELEVLPHEPPAA